MMHYNYLAKKRHIPSPPFSRVGDHMTRMEQHERLQRDVNDSDKAAKKGYKAHNKSSRNCHDT